MEHRPFLVLSGSRLMQVKWHSWVGVSKNQGSEGLRFLAGNETLPWSFIQLTSGLQGIVTAQSGSSS